MIHKIDYKTYEKPSDFIKFKIGENKIIILSNGGMVKKHGMMTGRGYVPMGDCTETLDCPQCLKGNEPKQKWIWIAYLPLTRQVKVLDVGPQIGNSICEQVQKMQIDPIGYEIIINRIGLGRDSQYTTVLGSKVQLTEKDKLFIEPTKKFLVKKYFEK